MSTVTSPHTTEAPRAVSELWYTRCPVPTASSIAISQGWLDDEFTPDDIAVASLRASDSASVRESHFDHKLDDSFRQGGNIPPIWTRGCKGAGRPGRARKGLFIRTAMRRS